MRYDNYSPHPTLIGLLKLMVDLKLFHQASGSLRVTTTLASWYAAKTSCDIVPIDAPQIPPTEEKQIGQKIKGNKRTSATIPPTGGKYGMYICIFTSRILFDRQKYQSITVFENTDGVWVGGQMENHEKKQK